MSNNEVKISSVKIKVGDVTVEMTIKQGKELYEMLAELFEKEVKVSYVPYYPYPNPCPPQRYEWETTWGDTTSGTGTVCYESTRERT